MSCPQHEFKIPENCRRRRKESHFFPSEEIRDCQGTVGTRFTASLISSGKIWGRGETRPYQSKALMPPFLGLGFFLRRLLHLLESSLKCLYSSRSLFPILCLSLYVVLPVSVVSAASHTIAHDPVQKVVTHG